MGYFVILPIPIDVLDAAIAEKLTYMANGFVDFTRHPITPVSSIYQLTQEQLGEVGEFRIRKLLEAQSELYVKNPQRPQSREQTEDEIAYVDSFSTKDDKIKAALEINDRISQERDALHKRRIDHLSATANGLLQRLKTDAFTWPQKDRNFVPLKKCLEDFASYVKSEARMSFWHPDGNTHKWISQPEQYAKRLLLTFLWAKIGNTALIFDEINAGAGRIDIFLAFPNEERAVIELKMCGSNYSLNYAQEGLNQIYHYMENKDARNAYLLVFDSRTRDFSKDLPSDNKHELYEVSTIVIDVRPKVKPI